MIRNWNHEKIKLLASYNYLPIINGLSNFSHPCQILSDIFTIEEVKGAILLTGIYEPEVALNLEVNKEIQLDSETASKCNVMREPPLSNCPMIICAGANEPEGWIDQSKCYLELCESKGIAATFKLVEDAHHFSLLDHASDEKHPLFKLIINFCH